MGISTERIYIGGTYVVVGRTSNLKIQLAMLNGISGLYHPSLFPENWSNDMKLVTEKFKFQHKLVFRSFPRRLWEWQIASI